MLLKLYSVKRLMVVYALFKFELALQVFLSKSSNVVSVLWYCVVTCIFEIHTHVTGVEVNAPNRPIIYLM